jgi:GNAT superfamily N-acetyltransferase
MSHNGGIEIRQLERLSPEDSGRLMGWGDNIFGTAHLSLTYRTKTPDDRRFVVYNHGDGPLSHVAVLKHNGHANGEPALIGGIGGVVTVPAAQRRGYATLLVRHATAFLRDDWQVDFALLFCIDRMRAYYERLEWKKVQCEVLLDQPDGKVQCPFHVMTMPFTSRFEIINSLDLGSASW